MACMKDSFVVVRVKRKSDGKPSLAWMLAWTLIPPFSLPVFGCYGQYP
jgi:hypothetical protein